MKEDKNIEIPWYYRLNRVLALVICLPAALYVLIGTIIPNQNIKKRVVTDKEIHDYTVKSKEYTSYRLKIENDEYVEVPFTFYSWAEVGDTLKLKTGIVDLTGYNLKELIKNGQVKMRVTDDALKLATLMSLLLLFPLLVFQDYKKWKDNIILRYFYAAIPLTIALGVLFFIFVAFLFS